MRQSRKASLPPPAPAAAELPPPLSLPRFSRWNKVLIFPLCVLFPGAGLLMAGLYLRQEDKEARRFAWICLGFALLGCLARIAAHSNDFKGLEENDALTQSFY